MTDDIANGELPPLAAIIYPAGCPVDLLLAGIAADLAACGLHVAGAVQEAHPAAAGHCDTLVLRDTRDGSTTGISEDRGAGATACRLDPGGLATVAVRLEAALDSHPDLIVLNRFGKAEAEGGGLRAVFAAAVLRGIPVLTAVRQANAAEWHSFHQGMATDLPPDRAALQAWVAQWRGNASDLRTA